MAEVTITIKHQPASEQQRCGVCAATFVPAEDSGSRVLGLKTGSQEFAFVMCGGCHSKWSHGTTVKIRSAPA